MPTTVTSVLSTTNNAHGTGLTVYTTLQAWEDACPANLVTDDKIWQGQAYNDGEFTAGVDISGMTVDSTRYVELTTASGQSFRDHASVQSNALAYDQTKGVGISINSAAGVIRCQVQYCRISKLQVKNTSTSSGAYGIRVNAANCTIEFNIFEGSNTNINQGVGQSSGGVSTFRNNFWVNRGNNANCGIFDNTVSSVFAFNTCVMPDSNTNGNRCFTNSHCSPVMKFNAVFGCGSFKVSGGVGAGSGYNCTDAAAATASTGDLVSKTMSSQFENSDSDWRLKSGADCINMGSDDATHGANDIAGTARPSGASSDAGCWEFVAGGGSTGNPWYAYAQM